MNYMEKKKVLFFGLGSIGKKHLNILIENYDFDLYAFRSDKGNPVKSVENIYDFDEAININPDIVFITNPPHLHIKTALSCLKAGIKNYFIEKPLSHSTEDLDIFQAECKKLNAYIYLGFDMRHTQVFKRLKELASERINELFYCYSLCSSYMPKWRPGRDYRKLYSSFKEQGGGVILDLAHEFDYNEGLFGKIISIKGIYGKISNLEIESEDFCDVSVQFQNKITCIIHLDYFSPYEERYIKMYTPTELIIGDFINKKVKIININGEKNDESFNYDGNSVFKDQMSFFLNKVEIGKHNFEYIKDAKELQEKMIKFKNNTLMIKRNSK